MNTMINHQPLPAERKSLKDVAAGAAARLNQPSAPVIDSDYPVGAKVLILDCENEGYEGHVAYIVQPAGVRKSKVEWFSPSGERHSAVVSHRALGLMEGPSKRFLEAAKLPEGDARRQTLLDQERAARIQDVRRGEGLPTAFGIGAMVRKPGIMGDLGKVGFVEHVDGKDAIVRYYDHTGRPDREMIRQPIEKLELLAEPSWRMKGLQRLPADSPKRSELLAAERDYRQNAARKSAELPKGGEKVLGVIQELRQGVNAAGREAVQGLNIEPGR